MTWAKVLRLCYQTTTEVDLLLEAATTIICTAQCSWSTVGRQPRQAMIILKWCQTWRTTADTLPWGCLR